MLRDADFIDQLPCDVKGEFTEFERANNQNQNLFEYKIRTLREKIKSKFVSNFVLFTINR